MWAAPALLKQYIEVSLCTQLENSYSENLETVCAFFLCKVILKTSSVTKQALKLLQPAVPVLPTDNRSLICRYFTYDLF